jgi:hypothetical protein
MAEVKTYLFDYKEVAEALVKKQGIHEGVWGIYMEFGIVGANINPGPSTETMVPAAIVPVMKIGIQRFDAPSSLTVDAAEVNSLAQAPQKPRKRARRTLDALKEGGNA